MVATHPAPDGSVDLRVEWRPGGLCRFGVSFDGRDFTPFDETFTARPGDVLHVVATDQQYCTRALDGLQIHLGSVYQQALNAPVSLSACEDHDDYDPGFEGPWPGGTRGRRTLN